MTRKRLAWSALGLVMLALGLSAPRYVRGALFLIRFSAPAGSDVAAQRDAPLEETELQIAASPRPIHARLYRLAGSAPRAGIVVAHGVHYRGIDEGRLVPFARALARSGLTVLTPELHDLTQYQVSQGDVSVIESAVDYLVGRRDIVADDEVGLLGFSFAGGLSLIAASNPRTQAHLKYVTSVGGHYDLSTVMQFLVTGQLLTPNGTQQVRPHEYGLVILTFQNLTHFVPEADQGAAHDAFLAWLHEDREQAVRSAAALQSPEGKHVFELLEQQRLKELSAALLEILVAHQNELAALSPKGRLNALHIPVNLLHGAHDSVIPPSETAWAANELAAAHVRHVSLITPLIEHVEVDKTADLLGKLRLVHFMAQLF